MEMKSFRNKKSQKEAAVERHTAFLGFKGKYHADSSEQNLLYTTTLPTLQTAGGGVKYTGDINDATEEEKQLDALYHFVADISGETTIDNLGIFTHLYELAKINQKKKGEAALYTSIEELANEINGVLVEFLTERMGESAENPPQARPWFHSDTNNSATGASKLNDYNQKTEALNSSATKQKKLGSNARVAAIVLFLSAASASAIIPLAASSLLSPFLMGGIVGGLALLTTIAAVIAINAKLKAKSANKKSELRKHIMKAYLEPLNTLENAVRLRKRESTIADLNERLSYQQTMVGALANVNAKAFQDRPTNDALIAKTETLKTENDALKAQNDELKTENGDLKAQIDKLNAELETQNAEHQTQPEKPSSRGLLRRVLKSGSSPKKADKNPQKRKAAELQKRPAAPVNPSATFTAANASFVDKGQPEFDTSTDLNRSVTNV